MACSLRRAAVRSILLVAVLLTLPMLAAFAGKNDPPPATGVPATTPPPVTLTINPDGTAVWDGEPLASVPDLENKLARQTEQDPKLQLYTCAFIPSAESAQEIGRRCSTCWNWRRNSVTCTCSPLPTSSG